MNSWVFPFFFLAFTTNLEKSGENPCTKMNNNRDKCPPRWKSRFTAQIEPFPPSTIREGVVKLGFSILRCRFISWISNHHFEWGLIMLLLISQLILLLWIRLDGGGFNFDANVELSRIQELSRWHRRKLSKAGKSICCPVSCKQTVLAWLDTI